ncbi:MAG: bifunctional hydroxymethylpyrimidine kinase/phosphomethylpyrimidine kinase [Candidatus Omnitrophica bacterium]|nr:bifunctional hydroxymethylpyrimidine kinase/phosphomethylpyrimidine kinase [Candidatus Omnitrophota bacterium]MBU4303332.1 bifunctional hydroxymethylpyrimidine kinase/phosphomethylpyrimidine kinase [Candidatus Omnitrophota bacterium]MBU4418266.1 bifunctional hydroxymethylpyrimidine kinase/phosphomethylpyrimidine kinase [Candidatus Omnitrophota bacterium]MBU4468343.1 bifunctional hydroxymethylpyrimidine kinase/phosphomethylpyrimidine kinase [Candidatus Omnitrophota bacterium]MCG2708017.1 PfkB
MSIIVLGTVALDSVKTPFGRRKELLGGSAAHFSMAARLFTGVNLIAIVGSDFPRRHISFLRSKGLNLSSLIMDKGKTFRWEGEYQGDLNSALTLNTQLGVLSVFKPQVSEAQRKIENIFLANVDPDIQEHLLTKMHSPKLVGLDSMNYWINTKRKELIKLLKHVDIYVANDQEARTLSGESNLIKAAKGLCSLGPEMVLIKKGEHGVIFYNKKFTFSLPAYPVEKVIDPTGAGDTFAGGFMGYLVKSGKINSAVIKKALAYGTVAASFNVEDFGLYRTSKLTRGDLERRLTKFKDCFSF